MNSLRLKNRMVFIKSTDLKQVSSDPIPGARRGKNFIYEDDSQSSSEMFSDVFDIESEFSELSKSNDLFNSIEKSEKKVES
jgi:hypothetical protein